MPCAVRTLPRTGGSGQRLRSSSHDSFRSIALTYRGEEEEEEVEENEGRRGVEERCGGEEQRGEIRERTKWSMSRGGRRMKEWREKRNEDRGEEEEN